MNACLARELASSHGCALHDGELAWLEMVQAAGEQRFERRGQRRRPPVLDRVREELLAEERVSPGRLDDLRAELGVNPAEVPDHLLAVLARSPSKSGPLRLDPFRPIVAPLRSGTTAPPDHR